jgi:hypothetical protein
MGVVRRTVALGLRVALWAWFPAVLIVTATLMASHLLALPQPVRNDPELVAALSGLRAPHTEGRWLAVHVLYAQCRCSQRLIDHLVSRPHPTNVTETVLLVGADAQIEQRVRAAGYRLVVVEPAQLTSRYHLSAAPLLAVLDPTRQVRYLGGYTREKQGADPQDTRIIADLMHENTVSELPLLGCAVSKELQAMLDPFGLRALANPK